MTLTAIVAVGLLEAASLLRGGASRAVWQPVFDRSFSGLALGAAMTPVLFAYGGWQTSSFLGGEVREPRRILPRALVLGVLGVVAVYVSVNFIYLRSLGASGLAATTAPASSVMRGLLGARGGQFIAAGIAFSAFGFLAQSMLTAPRVYFAMAEDGVFFAAVARVHPRTRAPIVAIALQGVWAIVIALSGSYAQVVNYVVAMDCLFIGLTAICLFVLRKKNAEPAGFRVPGHPLTTLLFIAAEWAVVAATFANDPWRASIGLLIALAGLPIYFLWR
jgi:APA family basic amino acid/polyamine antiporter